MNCSKYAEPNFSSDAYEGTAEYYVRYRVPYPQVLLDDLIKHSSLSSHCKLLDLASGPGRIAIPLAPLFSRVWANDAEPEMIAVGKREAKNKNADNIEWLLSRAEELQVESSSIDLITIGEAFHRLDQKTITNLALKWLKPGGHIAIVGCYGILNGNESWQEILKEVVRKWISHRS